MHWMNLHVFGLAYVFVIAVSAYFFGILVPVVGGPAFGLLLGIALGTVFGRPGNTAAGIVFSSKKILQWAIILLGCKISLQEIWQTGVDSFLVLTITLIVAFLSAYILGRFLKTPFNLNSLIAAGTAICGGSAIAAVSPIIKAKSDEIAYGVSTVFLLNMAALLAFPYVGRMLDLSDEGFGLWAGTAIHDTSSVVAAGYLFSDEAGVYATIVKLTRTAFIIPVVFIFAYIMSRRERQEPASMHMKKVFPWFIVWFVAASLLNTFNLIPPDLQEAADSLTKFMITMALAAIGLSANLRSMLRSGVKPFLLGVMVWIIVSAASLIVQYANGQW